ncbi:MCP four helix bundle domain-containing protein [Paraburkholderia dilworthii]|uniref:MCP four helix bundle domain-containing protein n=1 Tax=Paraburkholderia dilworthii TaxID=948106 RepID=UPI0003F5C6AE|nr:MCP four helix bundle domain-containing protein [Paraburkholderia dilworthii]
MTLTNIKIGTRLAIGFATLLVLLFALGAAALWPMSRVYEGTLELGNNWLPSVQAAGNMQAYVNSVRRTTLLALLANGPQEFQAQRAAHNEAITKLAAELADYQKLVSAPKEQQIYEQVKSAWGAYSGTDTNLRLPEGTMASRRRTIYRTEKPGPNSSSLMKTYRRRYRGESQR